MPIGNYVFRSEFAIKHQAKGREEGLQVGREEGLQIGREQGRVQADVAAILTVLEERGLVPTAEEHAILTSCTHEATLARWIRKAVTTPTVSALLADDAR